MNPSTATDSRQPLRTGPLAMVWAATLAVSAGAGWSARGPAATAQPDPATRPAASAAPARPASPVLPGAAAPLIVVSGDGQVTLRVEQQPLDWVLEQIAAQSGRREIAAAGVRAPAVASAETGAGGEADAAAATTCPAHAAPDPARLLFEIEHGPETGRADALLRARADGLPVPEPLLRTLLESAASERVRLAALENWLELRAGDPKAERAALESALLVSSAAVQQEARQRLDDLDEMERLDALSAQGGRSP